MHHNNMSQLAIFHWQFYPLTKHRAMNIWPKILIIFKKPNKYMWQKTNNGKKGY